MGVPVADCREVTFRPQAPESHFSVMQCMFYGRADQLPNRLSRKQLLSSLYNLFLCVFCKSIKLKRFSKSKNCMICHILPIAFGL
jgi:hypothetical protein